MKERPVVAVFGTGGTIAASATGGGPVSPRMTVADLVQRLPGLDGEADLRLVNFRQVPSVELTLTDVVGLAEQLRQEAQDGQLAGFVITQGTDTLEECAFALDLLWELQTPIAVTGAMRHPDAPGSDGSSNLLAAIRVAASPQASGMGALVVLNDEIHLARNARKVHTSGVGAFQSPGRGPIGSVNEGQVAIWAQPVGSLRLHVPHSSKGDIPVALHRVVIGDDGRDLDGLVDRGYRGVVIEGLGGGHVPSRLVEALDRLAGSIPVVLASRAGAGYVLKHTYGFPGSETDLLQRGLISSGSLDGLKARVLLALLLMGDASQNDIGKAFAHFEPPTG